MNADIGVFGTHAAYTQGLPRIGIAMEFLRDHTLFIFARLKHRRRGAIAKQHRHVSILPIHEFRNVFDTDHQHVFGRARLDERSGNGHAVKKTGAGGVYIHRRRLVRTQFYLQARGAVRHVLIGAAASINDEIEFRCIHAGAGQRAHRCHVRKLQARHVRYAALLHAGTAHDPLVVRRQKSREILVGENRGGQAFAPTHNGGLCHGFFLAPNRVARPQATLPVVASCYDRHCRANCALRRIADQKKVPAIERARLSRQRDFK